MEIVKHENVCKRIEGWKDEVHLGSARRRKSLYVLTSVTSVKRGIVRYIIDGELQYYKKKNLSIKIILGECIWKF